MEEASVDKMVEQEDTTVLRSTYQFLDTKRRAALDKLLDIKGSIRVFCRIRPFNSVENWRNSFPVSVETDKIKIKSLGSKKEFVVDRAFDQNSTQEDIYKEVEPVIKSAFDGHNVCVLTYGQTGTGKTYTMEGVQRNPGIVLRAMKELFREISQEKCENYTLTMSMLEVYMGCLKDLLAPKQHPLRMDPATKSNISIMSRNNGTVEIEGLTDAEIMNFKQASRLYDKGRRARATSWTNVNETSSRSHCLTRIIIREGEKGKVISKIWLVDLGGSERLLKTGAIGQTLDEGKSINLSLSALGDVIAALKQRKHHVPYRNSKLTQILSDSLGEGSRVVMVVHTSPSEDDLLETICTLTFAKRVRSIESNRELSEETKKIRQKRIAELGHIIEEAEKELQILKMQIEKAESPITEKNQAQFADVSPRSPLVLEQVEFTESSQNTKQILKTLGPKTKPRFMAPTASSQQRQSAAGESIKNLKNSKYGNKRNMNFSGSQSLSVTGPFTSNLKSRSVDQGPRGVSLSSNIPAVRNSLPRHRRRISAC
ncbi:P-loop containing nucleoside triphosphate hydrolases superfamily protein isoform X1 [Carex rostrata]